MSGIIDDVESWTKVITLIKQPIGYFSKKICCLLRLLRKHESNFIFILLSYNRKKAEEIIPIKNHKTVLNPPKIQKIKKAPQPR